MPQENNAQKIEKMDELVQAMILAAKDNDADLIRSLRTESDDLFDDPAKDLNTVEREYDNIRQGCVLYLDKKYPEEFRQKILLDVQTRYYKIKCEKK